MARYWDNKEIAGRGTKFCLVIDPEDGTNPIRTYGWTKDEVLDKVAKTTEEAQRMISRQRSEATVIPPAVAVVSPEDVMQATMDLNNPAKSSDAIKTLLLSAGVDVDQVKLNEDAKRVGLIAQKWEIGHPEFPKDPRNQRLLMDKALLKTGARLGDITAEVLEAAYQELVGNNMLFSVPVVASTVTEEEEEEALANAPNGNSATRIERTRTATSYRSNTLRSTTVPPGGKREPKYTRADVDRMNSAQLRDKIENDREFMKWYNTEFSAAQ